MSTSHVIDAVRTTRGRGKAGKGYFGAMGVGSGAMDLVEAGGVESIHTERLS